MSSSTLFQFMESEQRDSRGEPLHWGRADLDGAPFAGPAVPLATEEELETRLVRTAQPFAKVFDLADAKDHAEYNEVRRMIYNGRGVLTAEPIRHKSIENGKLHVQVFLEWSLFYMKDGQPQLSQRPYLGRPND